MRQIMTWRGAEGTGGHPLLARSRALKEASHGPHPQDDCLYRRAEGDVGAVGILAETAALKQAVSDYELGS